MMSTSEFKLNLAVVIGINAYQNGIPALGTARQDAEVLAEILERDYHYQVHLITDNEATADNIKRWLETDLPEVMKTVNPSRFLFYFAGHGIALNGDDGPEGYLIPQNARLGDVSTYLPMSQVYEALIQLSCRHFLGILDCCFAGAFRWSSTRKLVPIELGTIHKERFDRFIQDPAWQVITSAAHDQTASDSFNLKDDRGQKGGHSPFAAALMDALQGKADAYPVAEPGKPAGDGVITATELYLYLRDRVEVATEARSLRQTPGIYPLKKHDKGEYIFLAPGHPLNLPPAPPLDVSSNPYRGLESFDEAHKDLFFGRKALTQQLSEFITSHSLTVVLGASGSGKSSLVKAGLIPTLRQRQEWHLLPPFRPGESPFKALEQAVESLILSAIDTNATDGSIALDTPAASSDLPALAQRLGHWFKAHPQAHLLVVVDQFEEIITLCRDEQERQQFLNTLAEDLASYPTQLHLVLTLRSDFEPQFRNTALEQSWQAARFVVPAMTREELRQAIEEPASAKVMYFDPHELVDQLIDEVANMPGALPLLSFALSELYLKYLERQEKAKNRGETLDRAITQADYEELGGVTRSLTQRAEREYGDLVQEDPVYEHTIRNVMLRMVSVGGELARRRVPLSELEYPEPENSRAKEVVQRFSSARLIVGGQDTEGNLYVEPAHDALIQGWDKIQNWKNEDKEGLALQGLLTSVAQEWVNNRRKNGSLWDDNPRILLLRQVLKSKHSWLNFLESEFVEKSLQRRKNNHLRLTSAVSGTIASLAGIGLFALIQLQLSVLREKAATVTNQLSIAPLNSLILAIEATDESASRLRKVLSPVQYSLFNAVSGSREQNLLRGHEGSVLSVVFSPDGQLIASSGEDGTIRLWNLIGQSVGVFTGHEKSIAEYDNENKNVNSVVFSPNGENIVSGGDDGTVRMWDLQGNQVALLGSFSVPIDAVAFHPNGSMFAVTSETKVWLLNLQSNIIQVLPNSESPSYSRRAAIRFTPDGKFLVNQAGGDLNVFNLAGELVDSERVADRSNHTICPLAIETNSSNLTDYSILSGQCWLGGIMPSNYEVRKFGLDSEGNLSESNFPQQELKFVSDCQAEILSLDVTSTGMIISGCGDGVISMGRESISVSSKLRGHTASVNAVAINPDKKHLVSADSNGEIRLWDLSNFLNVTELQYRNPQYQGKSIEMEPYWDYTYSVASDPKGEFWAIARQQTVMLLDMKGNLVAHPFKHHRTVTLVAFNPIDRTIISYDTSYDSSATPKGSFHLWDIQGNLIRDTEVDGVVKSIAFSPDGQMIVSGDEVGTLRLWALSGQQVRTFKGHESAVTSVAFSPDGQSIISGSNDKTLRLWDLQGNTLHTFKGHENNITSVAFSPDGKSVLSGSDDDTLRLWNLKGEPITIFRGHTRAVKSVAFNPTGDIIISSSLDKSVRFWATDGSPIALPFEDAEASPPRFSMIAISSDGKTILSSMGGGDKYDDSKLFSIRGWNSWQELLDFGCGRLRFHPVLINPATSEQRNAKAACQRRRVE